LLGKMRTAADLALDRVAQRGVEAEEQHSRVLLAGRSCRTQVSGALHGRGGLAAAGHAADDDFTLKGRRHDLALQRRQLVDWHFGSHHRWSQPALLGRIYPHLWVVMNRSG
jgi:hypothetical protein